MNRVSSLTMGPQAAPNPRLLRSLAFASTLAIAGCGVPLGAPEGIGPINSCTTSHDCSDGAACSQGVCTATFFDLAGLRLEVRPHANATYGATTSYIFDPGSEGVQLVSSGGSTDPFVVRYKAQLPPPVSIVKGRIVVDMQTKLDTQCHLSADRAVPGRVTFYRLSPFVGFPFDPVVAHTDPTTLDINVDLVPGTYDIYVEPEKVDGCNGGNPYPPMFLRSRTIAPGSMGFPLPPPGKLSGSVLGFDSAGDAQWSADLVERTRGLVISSNATLTAVPGGYTMNAQISWPDKTTAPILRLTPADASKPTVYWSLDGAVFGGNDANPSVNFSVDQLAVTAVPVSGQVLDADGHAGVAARLTIQSKTLQGPDGQNASFSLDGVMADPITGFTTKLPPGDYTIRAFPLVDNGLAVTDLDLLWPKVDTDCVCARNWNLKAKISLGGKVTTADGQQLDGTPIQLSPSQPGVRAYWADTHLLDAVSTRSASTSTDDSGHFLVLIDRGKSDFSVQPQQGSNFPWLVLPGLDLESDARNSNFALKNPGFLSGTVLDPTGVPVVNAEVNAWFPVRDKSKGGLTGTVVQIATTSTDANGNYTLVLPSSI